MRIARPATTPTIMATVFPTWSSLEESIHTQQKAKVTRELISTIKSAYIMHKDLDGD